MRKESVTVQKCKKQMASLGFDSQLAYHRVKLILKIYRDVVWVLSERAEELHEYAWELGNRDADTVLFGSDNQADPHLSTTAKQGASGSIRPQNSLWRAVSQRLRQGQ